MEKPIDIECDGYSQERRKDVEKIVLTNGQLRKRMADAGMSWRETHWEATSKDTSPWKSRYSNLDGVVFLTESGDCHAIFHEYAAYGKGYSEIYLGVPDFIGTGGEELDRFVRLYRRFCTDFANERMEAREKAKAEAEA